MARRLKQTPRNRRLTPEEAAKYRRIREQVAAELPELVSRHRERMADLASLDRLFLELKGLREAQGLSLNDVRLRTGMDRAALSKLENGVRSNCTVETLVRYAQAVGKRLVVLLEDERPAKASESMRHAATVHA